MITDSLMRLLSNDLCELSCGQTGHLSGQVMFSLLWPILLRSKPLPSGISERTPLNVSRAIAQQDPNHSNAQVREYFIPDFSLWKDHDAFEAAFSRLLRDLKTEEHL